MHLDLVVFQGSGNCAGELVFILFLSESRGITHDIISSALFSLRSIHLLEHPFVGLSTNTTTIHIQTLSTGGYPWLLSPPVAMFEIRDRRIRPSRLKAPIQASI